ncbi:MAG: c-type cytochrome [Nitrospirae bacterium]|nr:c-type cytochrome [Nitrospirota bacterium]
MPSAGHLTSLRVPLAIRLANKQRAFHIVLSAASKVLLLTVVLCLTLPAGTALCQERAIPPGKLGETIALGREISLNTAQHPLSKPYKGNALNCSSCHLKNGTDLNNLPYAGVAAAYPAYSPREDAVVTLADRISYCFMRSMNGIQPPVDGAMVTAIAAYITWLSEGTAIKMNSVAALGPNSMKQINVNPDDVNLENGRKVYEGQCAACHGEHGEGVKEIQLPEASPGGSPPLWGNNSYNKGAGMYELQKAASFIKSSMPYAAANLSEKDAADAAAYINSKERPDFVLKRHLPKAAPRVKLSD